MEVDTVEAVSPSDLASKVDEVTCCLGDNEKRALCNDADEEMCCEDESEVLTGLDDSGWVLVASPPNVELDAAATDVGSTVESTTCS